MTPDEILALLEEAAIAADGWHTVGTALRKQGLEDREHPLWKYVFAFEYMYVEASNKDYFDRYGPFAPWIEMQGVIFPPPLDTLNNDILEDWANVLQYAKNPIVCSRLADLLWVRKWGVRPDLLARQAIDAYFAVSEGDWIELERGFCLIRALDLSKAINDPQRKAKAIALIIDDTYRELKSEDPKPGVSLRLIESLMSLPKAETPGEVDALLDLALSVHEKNAWIAESILDMMIRRSNVEKQRELQLYQISLWIEEANRSEKGLSQLFHLEHALELARNYGFQDVADEVRRRIQSVPEEELDLKTISGQVEVPLETVEKYLNWFVDERGWRESLIRFGSYGPPSGDYKNNLEEIEKQARDFPLQFLVTRAVYDENNAPIRFGRTVDENKVIALARQETLGITIFGSTAPDILQRITDKHGFPPSHDLVDFFTTSIISKDVSANIATALEWYFKGEYDVAAHLLVPRIENIIRTLAREIGLPIIREPVGATPGGVVQLGSLLIRLEGLMDESWRRYFYNLLANPIGMNLRNRICHGLLTNATKEEAALLIHVVCNLRLIKISKTDEHGNPIS